jgi:hypothetical protein
MGDVAVARVVLEVLEGAPVLDEHRPSRAGEVSAGAKDSGRCSSSRSILSMAKNTGSHFQTFQNLLIRMPIRKTTKGPSISAVTRLSMISAMATPVPI